MSPKIANALRGVDGYTGGEHPRPETLRAYQKGALPKVEQEKVQDHLVSCEACSDTVLDLATFFSGAPRQGRLDPDKLVEAWNELARNLEVR